MMKNSFLIIVFVNLFLFQCDVNKEKRKQLKRTDKNGEIEKFEYFISNNDTIIDGIYEKKYGNGNLKVKGGFKFNELHGYLTFFKKNGHKEKTSLMDSGYKLETSLFDKKGKLNKYLLYDYEENLRFIISYSNKTVVKYDGLPIFRALKDKGDINYFNSEIKVDDVLIYKIVVANIPYAKRSIKVISNHRNNEIYLVYQNDSTLITVEDTNHEKGMYSIKYAVEYKFNDHVTPILSDTLAVKYIVK